MMQAGDTARQPECLSVYLDGRPEHVEFHDYSVNSVRPSLVNINGSNRNQSAHCVVTKNGEEPILRTAKPQHIKSIYVNTRSITCMHLLIVRARLHNSADHGVWTKSKQKLTESQVPISSWLRNSGTIVGLAA